MTENIIWNYKKKKISQDCDNLALIFSMVITGRTQSDIRWIICGIDSYIWVDCFKNCKSFSFLCGPNILNMSSCAFHNSKVKEPLNLENPTENYNYARFTAVNGQWHLSQDIVLSEIHFTPAYSSCSLWNLKEGKLFPFIRMH